nr:type I restriction-modification enzyme R subunit C-terminal domain-containing protein [Rhizobium laguerreae]
MCPRHHARLAIPGWIEDFWYQHWSAPGLRFSRSASTADQIEFIDMVIEHLTEKGVMDPGLLYENPFIDIAPDDGNRSST